MKNVMKITIGLMISATAVASAQDQKEKHFKKDSSYKTTYEIGRAHV